MMLATVGMRIYLLLFLCTSSGWAWQPNVKQKETICSSFHCQKRGMKYFENMDMDVDPCQNFFDFACGKWIQNNPGPKYVWEWNVAATMVKRVANFLKVILEDPRVTSKVKDFNAFKTVYQTCIGAPSFPRSDARVIKAKILSVGRYPDVPLWEIHNRYLKLTGKSAFFESGVVSYMKDDIYPVLLLYELYSAYGSILHERHWKAAEERAYVEFLFTMMKSLKLPNTDYVLKERIKKVFKFRKQFDEIINKNRDLPHVAYGPFTLSEIEASMRKENLKKTQRVPWAETARILLKSLSSDIVETKRVMDIRQKEYFVDLLNLLKNTSEDILAYHMEIYFVETHLKFSQSLYKLLESTSIEPYTLLQYIRSDTERWEDCITLINVPMFFGKLYKEKFFTQTERKMVGEIIQQLKPAMEKQMDQSSWLDKHTRLQIVQYLYGLTDWIGFPSWYDKSNIPVPDNMVQLEPLTPNALLSMHHSVLYVRAGLMLPPIFDQHLPELYNYACLGTSIGHELYHIIHDCGTYPTTITRPVKTQTWWSDKMREECYLRKHRFITQYNKLTASELKHRYGIGHIFIDTSKRFTENYPDVMGLDAAYKAYKKLLKRNKRICRTLPKFENFSCDQMFFISFANAFCEIKTKKAALYELEHGTHSANFIRVNGAVMNNRNFGEAFNCPIGSPMNPESKLNIWM